ncbi:MAG: hypothetical protein IPP66_07405 [Anaerolineales bacterium]|nr:hypothetical protein [Anaerolineales bacterium]
MADHFDRDYSLPFLLPRRMVITALTEATLKKIKLPLLFISLGIVLYACNFPSETSSSTQVTNRNPSNLVATVILRVDATQAKAATTTSISPAPSETALPISTPIPPNTPVWSLYNYTCELATGGGTMTMNLTWTDRSNGEEGYKVYRDGKVIAWLTPNSTSYVDVAYVAAGKVLQYSVEAYNTAWQLSTSTITYGC